MKDNPAALKLTLFGTLQIEAEGAVLSGRLAKKELWLLALLAMRPGKAVTREYLAALLWPDAPEDMALFYLRRTLSNLRTALGTQGDHLQVLKPRSLLLDVTDVFVDTVAFDKLLAQGGLVALQQAVALYRAPLLEECHEDWAAQERITRELAYLSALDTLADHAVSQQEWTDAIRYARLLIAVDALQEKAHRTLMQALAQSGNHAAAAQAYRDLRLRLREEINADPDPETIALQDAIRQEARQVPVERPRVTPSSVALPPPARKDSLPQPLSRLIGREEDQEAILAYLKSSRLVTLVAAGGVGKTRLSIEVARRSATCYADGASFVEFAALTDPDFLPRAVVQALGITEEPNVTPTHTLLRALQDKECLLVFDNCEHLLDACAGLASKLLAGCSKVRLLATSRQAFGVPAEIVWRVPSLPVPPVEAMQANVLESKGDTSVILECAAVQLFLDRVYQTAPEFRLSPKTLPLIAQICRRLDGIPLALELAAYRVRALSLEKIAERLEDRFRLLTSGNRAALPRQQTLRALIDWSYALLAPLEQQVFARLSVFVNGWTLATAEAICCGTGIETWEVVDLLTSLADKSLVVYECSEGMDRYRFLETIREYAWERLEESGEQADQQRRHGAYFVDLGEEADRRLIGPEQTQWLACLELEHDNLRAALAWSRAGTEGTESLRLVGGMWRFWYLRGYWQEGKEHLLKALADAGQGADPRARAAALNGVGVITYRLGDFDQASALLLECMALREGMEDTNGLAAVLHNLANVEWNQGNLDKAHAHYKRSLEINREIGNINRQGYSLLGMGNVALSQADHATARPAYEEAVNLFRTCSDQAGELLALGNLAIVALQSGDLDAAKSYGTRGLELCHLLNHCEGESLHLSIFASIAKLRGDYPRARHYFDQVLQSAQQLGDKRVLVTTLEGQASVCLAQRHYRLAVRLYSCTTVWHDRIGLGRSMQDSASYEQNLIALRTELGEESYQSLWQEGQALSLAEAVRLTLS